MLMKQDWSCEERLRIAAEWADLLAHKLKRSAAEIREQGLNVHDFDFYERVLVNFYDGSTASLRDAFYVVDEEKKLLAIFTEHCGYFIFSAEEIQVIGVNEDAWTGELWERFTE
jgi:hypothetical protein